MDCVIYSSENCPRCEILKRYFYNHNIEHTVRMVEQPEVKVEALMLNIYSTPAVVVGEDILHQQDLFQGNRIDEAVLLSFLGRNGIGKT